MKNSLNKFRKTILPLVFGGLFSLGVLAQSEPEKSSGEFWNNVRFGGGIGLSFGDGFFSGTLAPSAIYQFNHYFGMGIGLNGTYNTRKDVYKSTIIGGSILALFNPIQEIQLSSEFEQLHVNRNFDENFVSNLDDTYWYPALFLGAGYRTGNVTVGIRYDVLYDEDKSIYADPWIPFIRVYF
ncbi:MAG: alpha-ketoglutarate decarboxylase [Flavobacteriaceae bacterium]|nr:alpha-ketoglutarate decarboxylase [Flavobacteriaceae bacterium]